MSYPPKALAVIILCLLFASGCGQKGPLYLPGSPSQIRSEIPPQEQAPTANNEEEEEEKGTR